MGTLTQTLAADVAYTPAFLIADKDVPKLAKKLPLPVTQTAPDKSRGFVPISPLLTNHLILLGEVETCHLFSCQMLLKLREKSNQSLTLLNQALPGITMLAIMPMVPLLADGQATRQIVQFFKRIHLSHQLYPLIQEVENQMYKLTLSAEQQTAMQRFVVKAAKAHSK